MQKFKDAGAAGAAGNAGSWPDKPNKGLKTRDEIYAIVKHLPLYKRKNREEVFLGIKKSKNKNWAGWQYIAEIRKDQNFDKLLIDLGIYELALNFWIFSDLNGEIVDLEHLLKNYEF